MSSNMRIPKICQECGSDFIAKTTVTQYCSDRCSKRAYKKRKRK
ncbi:MAG TPA: DNA-binding protein, partial [Flavobacteriales bacterium]|nr:DNA-binding protein [Flavobacteriales bacterium]